MGLAGSWLGLLGDWHWILDLCSHFRWQGTVVALVALAWAGWRKRHGVMGVAVLTLLLNGWLLAFPAGPGKPGSLQPGFQVRVISFNVLTSNQDHAAVLNWLQQADADIIFLMEVDRIWEKALEPLLTTHPHHLIQPRSDNFGLAFYSRLPLENVRILKEDDLLEPEARGAELCQDSIEARLTTGGREWIFIGTHPVPPMGGEYAAGRDRQLLALSRHIAKAGAPVLVAGDLNASPWSVGFRRIMDGTTLRAAPGAWKPTWRVGSLFAIPIDHALGTPPLVFADRTIGPYLGSDHRPQVLEVKMDSQSSAGLKTATCPTNQLRKLQDQPWRLFVVTNGTTRIFAPQWWSRPRETEECQSRSNPWY